MSRASYLSILSEPESQPCSSLAGIFTGYDFVNFFLYVRNIEHQAMHNFELSATIMTNSSTAQNITL
jgi:hypothetical protein